MKKHKVHKGKGGNPHIKRMGNNGITTGPKPNYGKASVIDQHRPATAQFTKENY